MEIGNELETAEKTAHLYDFDRGELFPFYFCTGRVSLFGMGNSSREYECFVSIALRKTLASFDHVQLEWNSMKCSSSFVK